MANIPKIVRKDAKALAKKRRDVKDKPFSFSPKSDIKPFNKAGVKQDEYMNTYSVKNSEKSSRSKEFVSGRGARIESRVQSLAQADAEHAEHKAWKKANPNYVYPGGTGDRK